MIRLLLNFRKLKSHSVPTGVGMIYPTDGKVLT